MPKSITLFPLRHSSHLVKVLNLGQVMVEILIHLIEIALVAEHSVEDSQCISGILIPGLILVELGKLDKFVEIPVIDRLGAPSLKRLDGVLLQLSPA